jgi:carbon monoxide dehydrogenase subunit G
MKIEIGKSYPLKCTPQVGWEFLQNLEGVAACMPGAKITERLDAHRYKGTVTARIGPATMSFRGEVEMRDVDPAARSLRLIGKGTDSTGSSGASLDLTARIDSAATSAPAPTAPARELNVLALAWSVLLSWLRRLFSRSAA